MDLPSVYRDTKIQAELSQHIYVGQVEISHIWGVLGCYLFGILTK